MEAVNKYKEQNQLWNSDIYAGKVGNTTWRHMFEIKDSAEELSTVRDIVSGNGSKEYIAPINEGRITSLYGPRAADGFHEGVDIAVAEGTPVYAVFKTEDAEGGEK